MTDPLGLINNTGGVNNIQPGKTVGLPGGSDTTNFKDVLLENIKMVNKLQQEADMAIEDLAAGRRDDLSNVMIAKQKSDMAFKLLLQVRNKMMDAYEEIKQIRV